MDTVFGSGGSGHSVSSHSEKEPGPGQRQKGPTIMDNSAVSIMSLSIGDIVHRMGADELASKSTSSSDPDDLAPLFDSSLRLTTSAVEKKRRPPQRTNSGDIDGPTVNNNASTDTMGISKVMDMSVATLGDQFSEFGESAAKMTQSQADMSFANVFEETDDVYVGNEGRT